MKIDVDRIGDLRAHPLMLGTEYRLVVRHSYDADLASDMVLGLSQFLYVVVLSSSEVSPPVLIDEAWHDSLIDTRNYRAICDEFFGRFVHHNPPLGIDIDHRSSTFLGISETVNLGLEIFGNSLVRRVWRRSAEVRPLRSVGL